MKDILMCNLRALLICIIGIKVNETTIQKNNLVKNNLVNKKYKLFEYESGRIFPDIDFCLQISQSKITINPDEIEASNTYRKGSYFEDEIIKTNEGKIIISKDLENELNEEWDGFVTEILKTDDKFNQENNEFIKEILGGL